MSSGSTQVYRQKLQTRSNRHARLEDLAGQLFVLAYSSWAQH